VDHWIGEREAWDRGVGLKIEAWSGVKQYLPQTAIAELFDNEGSEDGGWENEMAV
jgi:hypothetical protein